MRVHFDKLATDPGLGPCTTCPNATLAASASTRKSVARSWGVRESQYRINPGGGEATVSPSSGISLSAFSCLPSTKFPRPVLPPPSHYDDQDVFSSACFLDTPLSVVGTCPAQPWRRRCGGRNNDNVPSLHPLFGPWIQKTDRVIFGTCVGVLMLAMVDRWFSATATVMNAHWNQK